MVGRIQDGLSIQQAQEALTPLSARFHKEFPPQFSWDNWVGKDGGIHLSPLRDWRVGDERRKKEMKAVNTWVGFSGQVADAGTRRPSTEWPIQRYMWADLEVRSDDGRLPDWWNFSPNQCRGTSGLRISTDFSSGPNTCST